MWFGGERGVWGRGKGYFYLEEVFRRAVDLLEGLLARFGDGLHLVSLDFFPFGGWLVCLLCWCRERVGSGCGEGKLDALTSRW